VKNEDKRMVKILESDLTSRYIIHEPDLTDINTKKNNTRWLNR